MGAREAPPGGWPRRVSVSVTGIGIHSGQRATLTLHRTADPLAFRVGNVTIPATYEHVSETRRATTLAAEGAEVHMVEHLLAALAIRGYYHGVLIEVDGPEVPVLDGSAREWDQVLATFDAPSPPPAPLVLQQRHVVTSGESRIVAEPGTGEWCVEIDFPHPAIGQQRWCGSEASFAELLDARTFGFRNELETLQQHGLAHGASTDNVLVFTNDGTLNAPRGSNEPVRHKALDFVGDLALLGRPVHGLGTVVRGSHALHHQFVRALAKTYLTTGATKE